MKKKWGSAGKNFDIQMLKMKFSAKYDKFYEYDVEDDGKISPMFKRVIPQSYAVEERKNLN